LQNITFLAAANRGRRKEMNVLKSLLICLLLAVPCAARTITVDDDGPVDFNNIQAVIDASSDGDLIIVCPGTYTGEGNRDIDFKGKAITLLGWPGPENCIIDCQGSKANPHRGFKFHSDEDANSVVAGFTITNGYGPKDDVGIYVGSAGGAIFCSASSPTISNCIITGNSASNGGGICCCYGAAPRISNCRVSKNNGYGAGICCFDSSPEITNCVINNNVAPGTGNICGFGAGLYCTNSNPNIINCTFSGNLATCPDIPISSLLSAHGGAMYIDSGGPTVSNCILWNNKPDEIYGYPPAVVTYSDVYGGYSGTGNINANPGFANVASGDYHLKSQAGRWHPGSQTWVQDAVTSPCIDAGDPNSDWTAELWPHGKRINMGAYGGTSQASMSLSDAGNVADLNNNGFVDYNDLRLFTDKWLYQKVLLSEDLDRDGFVDSKDFAIFGGNWRWQE
jgi:hypothetical protein